MACRSNYFAVLGFVLAAQASAFASNAHTMFLEHNRQPLPGAGQSSDERWKQIINADRVNPDTLAREGSSQSEVEIGKLQAQAQSATDQAESIAEHLKSLKAEAEAAASSLKNAKDREELLWDEAQEKEVERREEDAKLAAGTAGWSARLAVQSQDIEDAKAQMEEARKDRTRVEAMALAAERDQYIQKAAAAEANEKLAAETARLEGQNAQKLLDKQELAETKKQLQKAKVQAAGLVHERDVAAMAEEAGLKMGMAAKTYKPGTPMAEAVATALADAVVAGQALEDQVKEAEAAGLKVDVAT